MMQVSSSVIRRRVGLGLPIRYLVPDKVADYIEANGLYGAGERCGGGAEDGRSGLIELEGRGDVHRFGVVELEGGAGVSDSAAGRTDSAKLAERIAAIASDRKAMDIRVIDLRGIVSYTDFFVICSGNTERQTKAIHDAIHEELKHADDRMLPRRTEGDREARWILLDYLDVVAHIFTPDAREYYRLEQLWGEAPARSVG